MLILPDESHTPIAIKLNFEGTNNTTEYEACIHGLEAALTLGIEEIEVLGGFGAYHLPNSREVKNQRKKLLPYHAYFEKLTQQFKKISFTPLPRKKKKFADALATQASMRNIPEGVKVRPITIEQRSSPVYYRNS